MRRSSSSVGGPTSSWASSTNSANGRDRGQGGVLVGTHHQHDADVEGRVEHEIEQPVGEHIGGLIADRFLELIDDEELRPGLVELADRLEGGERVTARHDHVGAPRTGHR